MPAPLYHPHAVDSGTSLAKALDFVGAKLRQHKEKTIRWDKNEHLVLEALQLEGMGFTLEYRRYTSGDFGWDLRPQAFLAKLGFKAVIIERKTLADLRDTGRLLSQLSRMNDSAALYMVLIDYRVDTDRKRAWSDEAILNAELSLQLNPAVFVTRCDAGMLAQRIASLYGWTQKAQHGLGSAVTG